MTIVCKAMIATAAALLASVAARAAPPSPPPAVGESVRDAEGNEVGTIRSVAGDAAVLWTGTVKVTLGLGSFRRRVTGLMIPMSRAALEEAAAGIQSKGDEAVRALLTTGASVFGKDGVAAGTVESIAGQEVTVMVGTAKAKLPITAFTRQGDQPRIAMTAAEFAASVQAQLPQLLPPAEGKPK